MDLEKLLIIIPNHRLGQNNLFSSESVFAAHTLSVSLFTLQEWHLFPHHLDLQMRSLHFRWWWLRKPSPILSCIVSMTSRCAPRHHTGGNLSLSWLTIEETVLQKWWVTHQITFSVIHTQATFYDYMGLKNCSIILHLIYIVLNHNISYLKGLRM